YRGKPAYCLLVFGLEAKTRVWLVLDGDTLYVDRNGNGDLTEEGKPVKKNGSGFDVGTITQADGSPRQTGIWGNPQSSGVRMVIRPEGKVQGFVGYDASNRLTFAERPADAPIVHIDGPLTFGWFNQPPVLTPGQNCRFFNVLGTQGLGK